MESISEIIGLLRELAPEVFAIYVRQQHVTAVAYILVGVLCIVVAVFLWRIGDDACENDQGGIAIFVCLLLLVATMLLVISGLRLANPEYYAIQALLGR